MRLPPQLEALLRHRRRLVPLLVLVAIVVVGARLASAVPREVSLRYELGPRHGSYTEARIGYRRDGEEVQSVRFAYSRGGAPPTFDHRPSLSPGRYEVVADIRGEGGVRTFVRAIDVPADGVVRLRLFEDGGSPRPSAAPDAGGAPRESAGVAP